MAQRPLAVRLQRNMHVMGDRMCLLHEGLVTGIYLKECEKITSHPVQIAVQEMLDSMENRDASNTLIISTHQLREALKKYNEVDTGRYNLLPSSACVKFYKGVKDAIKMKATVQRNG